MAMYLAGRFPSPVVQPPTRLPEGAELQVIKDALKGAGLLKREA
jgi:4-hydroxy-tetrahydrodipicolinate synthase